jgi:hypothetical protein
MALGDLVQASSFVLGLVSSAAPQCDDKRGCENARANHIEGQQDQSPAITLNKPGACPKVKLSRGIIRSGE